MATAPPARHRILGAALRHFRTESGHSLNDAAAVLKCDRSKISRLETGRRGIRPTELRDLLTAYGAEDAQLAAILDLARHVQDPNWWRLSRHSTEGHRDLINPAIFGAVVWAYEVLFIPAPLQTEDYARAIAASALATAGEDVREQFVRDHLTGAQLLFPGGGRLGFRGVVSEAALRQLVGDRAVMRAQLRQLVEVSEARPAISLQVLPFTAGARAARSGPFAIITSPGPGRPAMVCMAGQTDGVYLDDEDDVARYTLIFQQLRAAALPPAESARLIKQTADDW